MEQIPDWKTLTISLADLVNYCESEMYEVDTAGDREQVINQTLHRVIEHFAPMAHEHSEYMYNLNVCPRRYGFGVVPMNPNMRGVEECPLCKGNGQV